MNDLPDHLTLTIEEVKCILCSMALADHLGDASEAIAPLYEKLGLTYNNVRDTKALEACGMLAKYLKE